MSKDNWKMPRPVFRRSSGSLPEDFVERIADGPSEDVTQAPDIPSASNGEANLALLYAPPENLKSTAEKPIPQSAVADNIQPQPLISEQISASKIAVSEPLKAAKMGNGISGLLLGILLVVVAAIIAAIAVAAYFVMRHPPESTF